MDKEGDKKDVNNGWSISQAGDIERLYVGRNRGGRGMKRIENLFEIRMEGLAKHSLLRLVDMHEKDLKRRLGEGFIERGHSISKAVMSKKGLEKRTETLITPTTGILKWTKKEISNLDIMTRKMLIMAGAFHKQVT